MSTKITPPEVGLVAAITPPAVTPPQPQSIVERLKQKAKDSPPTERDLYLMRLVSKGHTMPQIQALMHKKYGKKLPYQMLQRILKTARERYMRYAETNVKGHQAQILDTLEMIKESLAPLVTGEGEEDGLPNLRAIDRMNAAIDREVKLRGLNEVTKLEVKNTSDNSDWLSSLGGQLQTVSLPPVLPPEVKEVIDISGTVVDLPDDWDE